MKKRKSSEIAVLLSLILLLVSGCGNRTDVSDDETTIYCLNADETGLIQVSYEMTDDSAEDQARAMLSELAATPEDIQYHAAIPEEIKVQQVEVTDGIVNVDFSSAYLLLSTVQEKLVRAAVAQSLLRIQGIEGVVITVNGERLVDNAGKTIGILNEDSFVQNADASLDTYQTTDLTLYFADASGEHLVRQTTEVKYNNNIPQEKLIVEKLLQGKTKEGAYPVFNPDTTILGVVITEGICYVNFDSEFLNSIYDVVPEVAIYSLVNSLVEGTDADQVQITVNGEKNVSYMGIVDLSQPLSADESWLFDEDSPS